MTLRLGSLFAGIGGFDLGFQRAGFQTAWAVELDKHAQAVLRLRFPEAALFSDVREVGAHNLGPVDVLTFGSPCQDLSIAGKRAGLAGGRSGLFHEAARVIRELREAYGGPSVAVWENVPGAFSSNGGHDFTAVVRAMAELGALDIGWRVLDSRHFGVAQRRKRILLVADFAGRRTEALLALEESLRRHYQESREAAEKAPRGAANRARGGSVVGALTTGAGNKFGAPEVDAGHYIVAAHGQANAEIRTDGTVPTLTCLHEAPIATYCSDLTSALCAADGPTGVSDQYAHEGKLIASFVQSVADPLVTGEQKTYTHEGTTFRTRNVQSWVQLEPRETVPQVESALSAAGDLSHTLTCNHGVTEDGIGRGTPIVAQPMAYRVHGEHSTAMQGNGTARVADPIEVARCLDTTGGYATSQGGTIVAQPYTLEVRGRDGERVLEYRQDGLANCLRTANGGRDGLGVGAVAIPSEPVAFTENQRNELRVLERAGALGTIRRGDAKNETLIACEKKSAVPMVNMQGGKGMALAQEDGPSYTLNAMHGHDVHAVAVQLPPLAGTLGGGSGARGWSNDLDTSGAFIPVTAPTLTAANDPSRSPQSQEVTHQVAAVHAVASIVRRLTPVECCRLQGFPDDWNEEGIDPAGRRYPMSDASRYKQLGNAVTVNVAEYLARRIAALLRESPKKASAHASQRKERVS